MGLFQLESDWLTEGGEERFTATKQHRMNNELVFVDEATFDKRRSEHCPTDIQVAVELDVHQIDQLPHKCSSLVILGRRLSSPTDAALPNLRAMEPFEVAIVARGVTSVDEYIGTFPADVQDVLTEIRQTIRTAARETEEGISYGIPVARLDGDNVVFFAGWKHHVSIYPVPTVDPGLETEIATYRAGKGTLKFPLNQPIPYDLIEGLTTALLEQRKSRPRKGA